MMHSVADVALAMDQFRAAAESRGLKLPDQLESDGTLHRCDVHGGRSDGAYLLHLDGIPAGGFQNWRDGIGWEDWRAEIGRRLTPDEEAALRARRVAMARARVRAEQVRHEKARKRAAAIWAAAQPASDDHPYLRAKAVGAHGIRVGTWTKYHHDDQASRWVETHVKNALLVPMRDAGGVLRSLQAIYPEAIAGRNKDFLSGGQTTGCLHLLGDVTDGKPLCVAEGYATAATIFQATGWPVAVAFDCGKLLAVARVLRTKYPGFPMIVCGDDDSDTPNNPGRTHAEAAAREIGAAVAFPEFAQ